MKKNKKSNVSVMKSVWTRSDEKAVRAKGLTSYFHHLCLLSKPNKKIIKNDDKNNEELKNEVTNHILRLENEKEAYFKCSLSLEFFVTPVLTSCGHYFEKNEIERHLQVNKYCPDCRHENLTVNDLMPDEKFKQVVNQIKYENKHFLDTIRNINSLATVKTCIEAYEQSVNAHVNAMMLSSLRVKRYIELFSAHIINSLKLNKDNTMHLRFWHNQTDHCWHGFGGTPIQQFRIPKRIYNMMQIVDKSYPNKEEFILALNKERTKVDDYKLVSFIKSFWRKPITTLVYEASDIEKITLKN